MCGIAGIVKKNANEIDVNRLKIINNSIQHRGPDGEGLAIYENALLAHRRLSIIDITTGQQPMYTKDRQYAISLNGEIYNYKILRQELEKEGCVFYTNSDTEVVLLGYVTWGLDILNKLRGMFAFAIWDQVNNECLIARDPFGIKPLFYTLGEGCLTFCSELRPLVKNSKSTPTASMESMDYFLRFSYIPAPLTIYNNIYKLLPGHFIKFNPQKTNSKISQIKYLLKEDWNKKDPDITKENVWDAITESVSSHLVADVPFGAFLSGGIDSTLIVRAMKEKLGSTFSTFAIGFNDNEYSELRYAEKVAKKYKLNLYTKIVDENDIEILDDIIEHYGEPFGDSSVIPTWNVSQLARSKVTMVLSGDGGDEFFGGYSTYVNWLQHSPKQYLIDMLKGREWYRFSRGSLGYLKKWAANKSCNFLDEWIPKFSYTNDDFRNLLLDEKHNSFVDKSCELFEQSHNDAKFFNRLDYAQYMDIHTNMPGHILPKVDIASMLNSLEVRTPLIDKEIYKISRQLPFKSKYDKYSVSPGKKNLKELVELDFGKEFVYRKKQGFSVPKHKWFYKNNVASNRLNEILNEPSNAVNLLFKRAFIYELMEQHERQIADNSNILWLLLVVGIWSEQNPAITFN
jgi:asparagine synthase (glutamine-hydrolysing)